MIKKASNHQPNDKIWKRHIIDPNSKRNIAHQSNGEKVPNYFSNGRKRCILMILIL